MVSLMSRLGFYKADGSVYACKCGPPECVAPCKAKRTQHRQGHIAACSAHLKLSPAATMTFNASAVVGGKAQVLQPHSLRALLSSIYSVTGLLALATAICLLMRRIPGLAVIM